MGRAENGAVPVGHEQVVTVLQAVGAGLGTEALLALLQLFQQAEVARHFGAHGVRRGKTRACRAVASGTSAGSVGLGEKRGRDLRGGQKSRGAGLVDGR